MLRLTRIIAVLVALAAPSLAHAQIMYQTPDGKNAMGVVEMCPAQGGYWYLPCGSPGALPRTFQIIPEGELGSFYISGYRFTNITGQATTTLKTGAGVLHTVCVNTPAATETITIYDNTAGSGTKIGTVTVFASTNPCFTYDVAFVNGLTLVTATASSDLTVSWR